MAGTSTFFFISCNSNLIHSSLFLGLRRTTVSVSEDTPRIKHSARKSSHVLSATEGSAKPNEPKEKIPSWASPDSDEPPPWARDQPNSPNQNTDLPFFVYLLASAIIAIAAIGSVFEYVNQNPLFGVLNSDSIFYAPILGFFAFTGIPVSGYLWFKSVQVANKEAEEQDKRDGYL